MSPKSSDKNYITPAGFKKLIEEWEQLTKIERPEVTRVVSWAASLGDRSENADYIYGKKRLREIDKRLRFLGKRIELAQVVDPLQINSSRVQFGATVRACDEEGVIKTYCIVGVDETQASKGLISWRSPIGRALLGNEVGDIVIVRTPTGEYELEIEEISYQELPLGEGHED